ncbi:hypothetical protein KM031_14565 [Gemmobacter fulvus]|uniref:Uncharacterized protein n=1 Tax=Gemmobacter fulvus TaxID=2840474 RepID=A0A975S180_9RHOB|nr:hypothetical protein [Gemmobacter fulvus]MBT9247491.1 hypothetical protein [Gemmobacter fulvus]QWK90036.1 hypothetical protein KM031_14565 [Gemmobacter fulvus]
MNYQKYIEWKKLSNDPMASDDFGLIERILKNKDEKDVTNFFNKFFSIKDGDLVQKKDFAEGARTHICGSEAGSIDNKDDDDKFDFI